MHWPVNYPSQVVSLPRAWWCWYIMLIRHHGKLVSTAMINYGLCRYGLIQVIIYLVTATWTVQAAWWARRNPNLMRSLTKRVTHRNPRNSLQVPESLFLGSRHQLSHRPWSIRYSLNQLSNCARSGPKISTSTSEASGISGRSWPWLGSITYLTMTTAPCSSCARY